MYEIIFDTKLKKKFIKLNKNEKIIIKEKILKLKENPNLGKHLINSKIWSLRVLKYRVLYEVKENKLIIILKIEHRKKVYREV